MAVSLVVGYGLIEAGYRAYLYYSYAVRADYYVAIMDARLPSINVNAPGNVFGPYPRGTVYTLTQYDQDDHPINRHQVHINNLGWVSHYDYTVAKPADEYRIAIVGASLTACLNNEDPWPDVLQRNLNHDHNLLTQLGVQRITVLNLGAAGSPLQNMANPLAVIARRFSPDFLVANFAIEDVVLFHPEIPFSPIPDEPAAPADTPVPRESINQAEFIVDGVEIPLICPGREGRTASNPECSVSRVWYVPPGRDIDGPELKELKRTVARQLLLHRVLLSSRPLALLELLGRPAIPRPQVADTISPAATQSQDIGIEPALRAFQIITQLHQNVMFAHNPLHWHLTGQSRPEILNGFISLAASRGFDIVQLEDHLPIQRGERDWARWYLDDGHWSDYGAQIYGEAMYRAIRSRLLATRGIIASAEDAACASSFAHFRDGRAAAARGDGNAALASMNAAIAALPADAAERFRRDITYRDCGFLADIHGDRAVLLEQRGESAVAASDWEQVLALAPDPSPYYQQRANLRGSSWVPGC